MRKQRRKNGQFAKKSTPHNKGKIRVCACRDCTFHREDPIGWRYVNHAGWQPDPECGKVFTYAYERQS